MRLGCPRDMPLLPEKHRDTPVPSSVAIAAGLHVIPEPLMGGVHSTHRPDKPLAQDHVLKLNTAKFLATTI